jgi:hypothetical protein
LGEKKKLGEKNKNVSKVKIARVNRGRKRGQTKE